MVFTAQKLRLHPELGNPTVLIIVNRIDPNTQITATFNAADVPNMVKAESRDALHMVLGQDARKIIITTIHKFGEADGELNPRKNIIALVDEAHRTQEGERRRLERCTVRGRFAGFPDCIARNADYRTVRFAMQQILIANGTRTSTAGLPKVAGPLHPRPMSTPRENRRAERYPNLATTDRTGHATRKRGRQNR